MSPVNVGTRLVPALLVRNMRETLTFYRALGFELRGCYPNEIAPTWAEVTRDGVALQFHVDAPHGTPPEHVCSGTFDIFPESVMTLAEELQGRVTFAWGPTSTSSHSPSRREDCRKGAERW